jgi:hypothetical protein
MGSPEVTVFTESKMARIGIQLHMQHDVREVFALRKGCKDVGLKSIGADENRQLD